MAREKMAPVLRSAFGKWNNTGLLGNGFEKGRAELRALLAVAREAVRWRLNSKPLDMSEEEFWRNPQLNVPNQGSEVLNRALARLRRASGVEGNSKLPANSGPAQSKKGARK